MSAGVVVVLTFSVVKCYPWDLDFIFFLSPATYKHTHTHTHTRLDYTIETYCGATRRVRDRGRGGLGELCPVRAAKHLLHEEAGLLPTARPANCITKPPSSALEPLRYNHGGAFDATDAPPIFPLFFLLILVVFLFRQCFFFLCISLF